MLLKVIWGALIAGLATVLIISAGLNGLQTVSLIGALPFSIVLFISAISLLKSVRKDYRETRLREEEERRQRIREDIENS
jgi:choline-glycine betaine transporter